MPFQFKSKSIFLTYPQCTITKEALLYYLIEKLQPLGARVGAELHEDGNPHLHAFVCTRDPFRTRDQACFDLYGFHPNLQAARKSSDVLDYCAKGGDYVDYGELPTAGTKRTYTDVASADSAEAAWSILRDEFPRDYVLNHERLEYFINKKFQRTIEEYMPDPNQNFNTDLFPELDQWIQQRLEVSERGGFAGGGPTGPERGAPRASQRRRERPAYPPGGPPFRGVPKRPYPASLDNGIRDAALGSPADVGRFLNNTFLNR